MPEPTDRADHTDTSTTSETTEPAAPRSTTAQRRPGVVRVNADLPENDVATLGRIAARNHVNKTSALVRALRTTELVEETVAGGGRVILEAADGTRREIVVP